MTDPRSRPRWRGPLRLCPAILGVLVLTLGCDRAKDAKKDAPPPPPPGRRGRGGATHRPDLRDFTARTDAVPTVEVRARVPGVLEQVRFKEGTEVKQGQIALRDPARRVRGGARVGARPARQGAGRSHEGPGHLHRRSGSRAARQSARPSSAKAQQDVARYRPLAEARAIPQQDLDTPLPRRRWPRPASRPPTPRSRTPSSSSGPQIQLAEAGGAVREGRRDPGGAEPRLHDGSIPRSTGSSGRLQVDRGNLVGKGEPTLLATVSAVDPIYADFAVAEADYLRLAQRIRLDPQGRCARHRSPTLELFLADDSRLPAQGPARLRRPGGRPEDGDHRGRGRVPQPASSVLRPGQFARVRAVIEERPDAILVPQAGRAGAAGRQDRAGGGRRRQGRAADRDAATSRIGESLHRLGRAQAAASA